MWASANSLPSLKEPVIKFGLEQVTDKYRAKLLVGTKDLIADLQTTYLFCPKHLLFGANLVVDLKGQTVTKYDFGVNMEPSPGSTIGVKHESLAKD